MPVCTLGRSPKVHRTPSPLHRWKDDLTFTGGGQQNPAGEHSVAVAIYGKLIECRRISRFSASYPAAEKTRWKPAPRWIWNQPTNGDKARFAIRSGGRLQSRNSEQGKLTSK